MGTTARPHRLTAQALQLPKRGERHPAQQRDGLGAPSGVRRRVEQAERAVRRGPRRLVREPRVQLAQRVDPDLDVTPLELAHRVARALGEVGEIAVLHDDQLRLALREVGLELDQRDEHLLRVAARRRALLAAREEVLADADQHLGEQGVLALEVPVERGPAHPDRRAEVGDAHPVVAVLGEELRGDRQDLRAPPRAAFDHGRRHRYRVPRFAQRRHSRASLLWSHDTGSAVAAGPRRGAGCVRAVGGGRGRSGAGGGGRGADPAGGAVAEPLGRNRCRAEGAGDRRPDARQLREARQRHVHPERERRRGARHADGSGATRRWRRSSSTTPTTRTAAAGPCRRAPTTARSAR